MKIIVVIAILAMPFLLAASVAGEMTEYQRGVANGLQIGFFMGELYGRGQYVAEAAGEFNGFLDRFQQFLVESFGDNQTLINEFMRGPILIRKPSGEMPKPDVGGRIYGYPADAYYTAVGAVPGTKPANPYDALPGV